MTTDELDARAAIFGHLLKPMTQELARRAARRWLAKTLAPAPPRGRKNRCRMGVEALKALFEQDWCAEGHSHHLPLAEFAKLVVAANLVRDGKVCAVFIDR